MAQQDFSLLLSIAPDAPAAKTVAPSSSMEFVDMVAPALVQRESGGKQLRPDGTPVTSKAGAIGKWQVMPDTAPEAAKIAGVEFNDLKFRTDEKYNEVLGRAYLAKQYDDFGGDPAKALAAYNAGPGRLRTALSTAEKAGQPQAWMQYMPKETQAYVPAILGRTSQPQGGYSGSFSNARPLVTDRTMGEAAADVALGAASGVVTGAKLLADTFGADNAVSKTLGGAAESLTELQSPYRQDQRAERAATIRAAEASGSTWNEIVANVGAFLEAPAETTFNALGTSAPTLLMSVIPGLGQAQAARLILQGAVGAAQGAGAAKSGIYEAVRDQLIASGMSRDDAEKAAAGAQAYDGQNGGMIAANAILGSIAGTSGVEAAAGRIAGRKAGETAARGIVGRAGMGVVKESPVEAAQGGLERATSNVALQNQGFDVPTMQGVAGQAALEGLASAPGGAVFGALDRGQPAAPAVPPALQPVVDQAQKPGSVLSRAAVAGNAGVLSQAAAPAGPGTPPPAAPAAGLEIGSTANPMGPGPSSDPFAVRAREIEGVIREGGLLDALRADGIDAREVFADLATMRNPEAPARIKEQAATRVEEMLSWAQANPQPRAPMDSIQGNPDFFPAPAPAREPATIPSVQPVADFLSNPATRGVVSDVDRQDLLQQLAVARNPEAGAGARAFAARQALETVGRYQAASSVAPAPAAPALERAAPAAAPVAAPAEQQNVGEPTELDFLTNAPEPRVSIPAGEGPALLRKRAAVVKQLADNGFETVVRDGRNFFMVNAKTGQKFQLDGPADAQLARKAIADRVNTLADTAAASPRNERTEPTQAQIDAGNYKKSDVIELNGMRIKIENPKDSIRRGVSPDGVSWETKMAHHYGEFQDTKGADGDKLDVFVGPRPDSNRVFVIDQVNEDGSFDEHKVMMGFTSEEAARAGYLANYEPGWTGLGAITEMSVDDFKAWAKSRQAKKPAASATVAQRAAAAPAPAPEPTSAPAPAPAAEPAAASPAPATAPAPAGPRGQFATYEEAADYIKQQRRASGSVSGLPLRLEDGSYTVVAKGAPGYAEAQKQRQERAPKQGEIFTVQDAGKPKKLKRVGKASLPKKAASARRLGEPRPLTQDEASLIEQIAAVLGKTVVFFESQDGRIGDGFFDPRTPDVLYVATETTVNPLAVFGHEFFHDLRESNPEAWNAIAAVVRTRVADPRGFRGDYYGAFVVRDARGNQLGAFGSRESAEAFVKKQGGKGLTIGEQSDRALSEEKGGELEELVSDLGGNLMMDPTFWRDVFAKIQEDNGAEGKGIVARLAAALEQFIARVMAAINQSGFAADGFVQDGKAIRAAYRDGLADFIKAAGIRQASMAADITKAKQDLLKTPDRLAQPGSLTVEGYHYSKQPRAVLTTGAFGTGLKGSARDEIMASPDERLRNRLYFYVNKGTGINPESGVGSFVHKATLTNIYDGDADPMRLKGGTARDFESRVLDAGFSGYLSRMEGTQSGQVILLGAQTVKPQLLGTDKVTNAKVVPAPEQRDQNLGDRIAANKALPSGQLTPSRWVEVLTAQMPEEAAQLLDLGALQGDKPMYKDELVRKVRELSGEIRKSADRAKSEYAEVVAKYKGTDQWMKAPNGQPTNLTQRQWVQVRTPSFKKWFGDWEKFAGMQGGVWNDADGEVSKVVDANGEPLVVYHGTDRGGFVEFSEPGGNDRGDLGIFTTDNYGMARSYVRRGRSRDIDLIIPSTEQEFEERGFLFERNDDGTVGVFDTEGFAIGKPFASMEEAMADVASYFQGEVGQQPGIYALFINLRNPQEENFEGALWSGEREDQYQVRDENDEPVYSADGRGYFDRDTAETLAEQNPGSEVQPADPYYQSTDDVVREARRYNDGAIIREVIDDGGGVGYDLEPSDVFVAFKPEQLKSADYNNGEFSDSTGDLRKSKDRADKKPKKMPQEAAIGDKTDVSKLPAGKAVPPSAGVGSLESSLSMARSKSYNRGRELKVDIQARVLEAAKAARVNLSAHTQENHRFLADLVVEDAKYALKSNENAIGWYDSKISRALGAIALIHPEINTDPKARLAFMWSLAVTSNGLKVNKNFEIAERAYREWRDTGKLPNDAGIGNAAGAINKGLDLYNLLGEKIGFERLAKFMATEFTVGEIDRMLGESVGGEWKSTPVRGAAILGPKIGNGFFSNLNGFFDALTMDRWLMRTFGRLTGTLIGVTKEDVTASREKLASKIEGLSADERKTMGQTIGVRINKNLTRAALDKIAAASQKASMKKDKRAVMSSTPAMNEFRKAANNHHMTLDGQKEAPSGPAERNWIRAIFATALEQLRADGKGMTMSDLQALLWYPERRLYDAAKSDEDVADGYEDDEAPDYANAALDLAVKSGFDRAAVVKAMDEAEAKGTVKGEPLTAEEKREMMREFRAAPKQSFHYAYEVAPDPADEELVARWGELTTQQRRDITDKVKDAVLADLIAATGAEVGKTVGATGGYAGLVNPNLITEFKKSKLPIGDARGLAAAIGFVLDQESVALVDDRASGVNGIVRITFSGKVEKFAPTIFSALRSAVPEVDGFTARGNNFDILNFVDNEGMTRAEHAVLIDQTNSELAGKIMEALESVDIPLEFTVSYGEVTSELVGKDDYEGQIERLRPESGQDVRAELGRLRDRAREIVADEIRNAGGSGPTTPAGGPGRGGSEPGGSAETAEQQELTAAEESGLAGEPWNPANQNVRLSKSRRQPPKKTVTAYKLFRVDERYPGKLFPLFVEASTPVPMGDWVDATDSYHFIAENGKPYVPNGRTGKNVAIPSQEVAEELVRRGLIKSVKTKAIKAVAYRPGWHAGDLPMSTHLGKNDPATGKVAIRPDGHVWAEVEMPADKDWQIQADKNGSASGKFIAGEAHITDQVPSGGFYRYKTNPNMTGNWLIGGSIKVNRVLSDDEVQDINDAAGVRDLPRERPLDLSRFGFADETYNQRVQALQDLIACLK